MIFAAITGVCIYLLICAAAVFCGRGVIKMARMQLPAEGEWAFAPVLTCLLWVLVLGVTVALRIPVKWVAPWLWAASGLFALIGMHGVWAQRRLLLCPALLCVVLPIVLMAPSFARGITETIATTDSDGWAYGVGGLYLWDYPRGAPVPDSPVYDFGWSMKDIRWISYTLLAFFSPLYRVRDPLAVAGVYQAWCMFTLGSAVYAFCVADQRRRLESIAITTFTIVSGWMANLLWTNNFDNMLSTIYMPAAAAIFLFWDGRQMVKWILLGMVTACSLYTYPECAPFCLGPALLVAGPTLWFARREWKWQLLGGTVALAVALLLWAPGAGELLPFMRAVQGIAYWPAGSRPGEGWFSGLLHSKGLFASWWGLGGECHGKARWSAMNPVGILLTLLLAVGVVRLTWSRRWGLPLALTSLVLAICYVVFHLHYDYGAYKLVVFSWWCVVAVTISGVGWMVQRLPRPEWKPWVIASLLILGSVGGWRASRMNLPLGGSQFLSMRASHARALRTLPPRIDGKPFLLLVEDGLPNLLAVYHLGHAVYYPGVLRGFPGEQAHTQRIRKGLVIDPGAIRHVLTDTTPLPWTDLKSQAQVVWSSGPYRLWDLAPAASDVFLLGVNSERGADASGPFFFMRHAPAEIYFYAKRPGVVQLTARFEIAGDQAETKYRTLDIQTLAGYQHTQIVASGCGCVTVPVVRGVNQITLKVKERFTGGPSQPFLLAVHDFMLSSLSP